MTAAPTPRPTDAELAILAVLWRRGPSTVRQVQGDLDDPGYTTVLKLLQIMTDKGLVVRDESSRAHVYAAARGEAETQGALVADLAERAFGGSAGRLAMRALSQRPASRVELAEIRRLLEAMDDEAAAGDGGRDDDEGTTGETR